MTDKNKTLYWIGHKGYAKFAETGPEMRLKEILEELEQRQGFTFKHGNQGFPLSVVCSSEDGTESFDFHPDFIVEMVKFSTRGKTSKIIEVDGRYHFTAIQERKRRWRDSLLLSKGYDIIHVDARYAWMKGYKNELKAKLWWCMVEGSPVEFIDA